ncbi:unnamed protein product [Clonostachys byssicola]|uniref:Uncharacterized protein n=1 Tax=Clonostachys byssicola TaxID=160290 RepID=A0A9N9YBM4_9HYPO|nr:unnamed protein product [Clonostachys byssicola]
MVVLPRQVFQSQEIGIAGLQLGDHFINLRLIYKCVFGRPGQNIVRRQIAPTDVAIWAAGGRGDPPPGPVTAKCRRDEPSIVPAVTLVNAVEILVREGSTGGVADEDVPAAGEVVLLHEELERGPNVVDVVRVFGGTQLRRGGFRSLGVFGMW